MRANKSKDPNTAIVQLIVIVLISQAFVIYMILERQPNANEVNNQITKYNQETLDKIEALANVINSISSSQSTLQGQISQLKVNNGNGMADFSGIIEEALKGVVTIRTSSAQGSGVIITDDGYILTNAHVVQQTSRIRVITSDERTHLARLIGSDEEMDIALLKIEGSYDSLPFGDSREVRIGDRVIAIGNPYSLAFTVTEGIISSLNRTGINDLPYYLQTDVSLNPGNSGGPLLNTDGQVIGINNFKIGGAENLGFALEANKARDSINQIAQSELNQNLSFN